MRTLLIAFMLLVPTSAIAAPFGGNVLAVRPCYNFSGFIITLGPPTPGEYVADAATFRYLFQTPYRPGQWLLGLVGSVAVCDVSPRRGLQGVSGVRILFHGSSL